MYYRIADVTLQSEIALPSFTVFAVHSITPDVRLCLTKENPPDGKEIRSGSIVHRVIPGGWYCHSEADASEGMFISSDYTSLRYRGRSGRSAERYVRLALECLLSRRGCISLHAAAVALNGEAFLFMGPSGIGKSTRAQAWIDAMGAELISGDRPLLNVETMELFGVPWDGKEQCFRNVYFPLRAVFEVRRSKCPRIRKLSAAQSRRLLARQCFMPMWDTETAMIQMQNLIRLSARGRILRAFSNPSPEAASALHEIILSQTELEAKPNMKAKPGFVLRNVVKEHILMPIDENISVYQGAVLLNSTSAFVWENLQQDISRDDLLAAILEEFDIDRATAEKDLDQLLEKLDQMNLIERT